MLIESKENALSIGAAHTLYNVHGNSRQNCFGKKVKFFLSKSVTVINWNSPLYYVFYVVN